MKQTLEFALLWVPWIQDKGAVNKELSIIYSAKIDLALGLFDDAIAAASAAINNGAHKFNGMTNRFGPQMRRENVNLGSAPAR